MKEAKKDLVRALISIVLCFVVAGIFYYVIQHDYEQAEVDSYTTAISEVKWVCSVYPSSCSEAKHRMKLLMNDRKLTVREYNEFLDWSSSLTKKDKARSMMEYLNEDDKK